MTRMKRVAKWVMFFGWWGGVFLMVLSFVMILEVMSGSSGVYVLQWFYGRLSISVPLGLAVNVCMASAVVLIFVSRWVAGLLSGREGE